MSSSTPVSGAAPASGSLIDRHLDPGEIVLWRAQPDRGQFLRRNRAIAGLGLGFLGIALFWILVSILFAGSFTPLVRTILLYWGLPSLVVAALLVIGPVLVSMREWANTEYALTNRRVIVQRGILRPRLSAIELDHLPRMEVQGQNGRGNLIFLQGTALSTIGQGGRGQYQPSALVLWAIPEPDNVLSLIRQAAEARHARPTAVE